MSSCCCRPVVLLKTYGETLAPGRWKQFPLAVRQFPLDLGKLLPLGLGKQVPLVWWPCSVYGVSCRRLDAPVVSGRSSRDCRLAGGVPRRYGGNGRFPRPVCAWRANSAPLARSCGARGSAGRGGWWEGDRLRSRRLPASGIAGGILPHPSIFVSPCQESKGRAVGKHSFAGMVRRYPARQRDPARG